APLQHAIRHVLAEHESMELSSLQADVLGNLRVGIRLTPLQTSGGALWDRILVSFIRRHDAVGAVDARGSSLLRDDLGADAAVDWKSEARVSREEMDASHEELLALNEELKASNEELSRSNQELNRSNFLLQENIAQLAMQNHVLLSGAVMTMFLDTELKLRWFTPSMRDVFPLKPADTGRRIDDLVPIFRDEDFYADIQCVLKASAPREAAIRDDGGRCFLRKIFPYLSETGAIVGVAITFADITDRTHAYVPALRY
ncbi:MULTISPECIES: PAS domain-containing protein, partial [unclassified Caballeronia]|uniref:PAS domain-containing protein n=1 Tax=unclassified Caballeronia TaxID=2646786 RepID=UPI002027FB13